MWGNDTTNAFGNIENFIKITFPFLLVNWKVYLMLWLFLEIASILDGLLLYEVWAMMDEANVHHSWLEFRLHPFLMDYYCMMDEANVDHSWLEFRLHPFLMDYYCMKYGLWWMRPMFITVGWSSDCIHSWWITIVWSMGYDGWGQWWSQLAGVQIASILDGLLLYEVWAMMEEANVDHSWLEFRLHPFMMDYYCMKYGPWWRRPMVITVGWSSDCIHSWWITIVWSMGYDGWGQWWSQLAGVQIASIHGGLLLYEVWAMMDEANVDHSWLEFRLHPFLMDYYCMKYGLWWMRPMLITVGWSSDCIHSCWITIVWSMVHDGWGQCWSQLAGFRLHPFLMDYYCMKYGLWWMKPMVITVGWSSDCIHSWWITIVWSMGYDGWGQCWSQLAGVQIAYILDGLLLYELWAMMDEANVHHSWLEFRSVWLTSARQKHVRNIGCR